VREERRITHFHLFYVGSLQVMQVLLARILMRKVVLTAHDVESFLEGLEVRALSRFIYRLAHRVIAHNQVSKKELIERIGLVPEVIEVIPHGNYLHANRPMPSQAESRRVLDIPEQAKVLLLFGQIKEVKGLDLLIDAMPTVLKHHPDAVLLIAGRPWKNDFSIYEKSMERQSIRDRCITHIRYIHDEEVPFYYGASDVVVLPYRRIYQSGVLLMAMSYGMPVIASDLEGMKEIIRDGENGLLFRSEDDEDLAARMREILSDPSRAASLGNAAREYVRRHHDWDFIGIQTKLLYDKLLRAAGGKR
jgi:glycosyltransferase involved in cell wall biosynthesis